jgi:hypothetical protein
MKRLLFLIVFLVPQTASALSQSCPAGTSGYVDLYNDLWTYCVDYLREERTAYLVCAGQAQAQDQLRGVAVGQPAPWIVALKPSAKIPSTALCSLQNAMTNFQSCEGTRASVRAYRDSCRAWLNYSTAITGIDSWGNGL